MGKRFAVVLGLLALVASACSSKPAVKPSTANTYTVQVDAKATTVNTAFLAFFPSELSAHPGDTVKFTHPQETGEPHTATLGTLVGAALAAVDALGPDPSEEAAGALPAMKKLPNILPEGPGDAIQAGAQPCFLATGEPPAKDACTAEQQKQPDFDGTQAYFNSGWLAEDDTFTVKLASTTAPGTYRFMCSLHREEMQGKITVVGKATTVPGPAEVSAKGQSDINDAATKLKAAVDAAAAQAKPGVVAEGIGTMEVRSGFVAQFVPKDVSVAAGATVTWNVFGPHTVSFNAPESVKLILSRAPDGGVHIDPNTVAPQGGPGVPEGPAPKKPVNLGSWNGQGFRSSGIILSFPPNLISVTLKFTTAGTYKYRCLIHTDMEGSVKVG